MDPVRRIRRSLTCGDGMTLSWDCAAIDGGGPDVGATG